MILAFLLSCATEVAAPPPEVVTLPTPPVPDAPKVAEGLSVHEWGLIDVVNDKVVHVSAWSTMRLTGEAVTVAWRPRADPAAAPVSVQIAPSGCAAPADMPCTTGTCEAPVWLEPGGACLGATANALRWESDAEVSIQQPLALYDGPKGTRIENLSADVLIGQTFRIHRDDDRDKTRVNAMFSHPAMPITLSPDYPLKELYIWPSNALFTVRGFDATDSTSVETALHPRLFGGVADPYAPVESVVYWLPAAAANAIPAPLFDPPPEAITRVFLVRIAR